MKPYSTMSDAEFLAEAHRIADACAERLPTTARTLRAIAPLVHLRPQAAAVMLVLEGSVFADLAIRVVSSAEERIDEIRGAA